jgi:non-ribosomal peptide synthetase component E (peptide arylation enzyme)
VVSKLISEDAAHITGETVYANGGVPDLFEFVDEIPKTGVGKLDKKELRKLYTK